MSSSEAAGKKRVSPFVVAIPAFILLAVFKLWPVILSVMISFLDYSRKLGVSGSVFVGWDHYAELFGYGWFGNMIRNTFVLTIMPAVFTAIMALILSRMINKLPRKWLKYFALAIVAAPAVLPTHILASVVWEIGDAHSSLTQTLIGINMIAPNQKLLTTPQLYPYIYTILETLKYMIFPIAYGVLTVSQAKKGSIRHLIKVSIGYILVRFAFMLVGDYELNVKLYNPMIYEIADTVSTFSYRKGLLEANIGLSAAMDNLRMVAQMAINIPIYFGLKKLFKDDHGIFLFDEIAEIKPVAYKIAAGLVLASFVVALLFGGLYIFSAVILFTVLSLLLAYPLTSKSKVYPLVLFLLLSVNCMTAEWIHYLNLGFKNSLFAGAVILGVSVFGAFSVLLATHGSNRNASTLKETLTKSIPVLILVVVIGVSTVVNTVYGRDERFPHIIKQVETDTSKIPVGKPVIYLYPEEKTDVDVYLKFNGKLTFTYPEYKNGWKVTAYPDGTLTDADGKSYSYLFWEGLSDVQFDFSKGFVVSREDTVEFLQEKLAYMGLTPKEYNEFIVYWAPQLMENKYNLITFQSECYTDNAKLIITPQPDSVLRVFMAAKPLDKMIATEEQKLQPFERKGFTLVEWGGSIIQ